MAEKKCSPDLNEIEGFVRSLKMKISKNGENVQIPEEKGSGAMGKVYQIGKSPCYYAAKVPKKNPKKPLANQELLMIEGTLLKKIQNRCSEFFLCFTAAFIIDGEYWLVTEYINYPDLFDSIVNPDPVPINAAAVKNLIDGLKALHDLDVAHLDIKPENIHYNPETNQIKYIDFGLACDQQTCRGGSGTLKMVPPETFEITTLEQAKKSDLWSLGVTIYLWLTGYEVEYDTRGGVNRGTLPGIITKYWEARFNGFQKRINEAKLNINIRKLMIDRTLDCFQS